MKRTFLLIFAIICLSLFCSCAMTRSPLTGFLYTNVESPITYRSGKNATHGYEILGEVTGEANAASILGIIATGEASCRKAYEKALEQNPNANGLIDICIDQRSESVLGIYAKTTTKLSAKAVRWIKIPDAISYTEASSQRKPERIESDSEKVNDDNDLVANINAFLGKGEKKHNIGVSITNKVGEAGGVGLRINYMMRRLGEKFSFNPSVRFANVKGQYIYSSYGYKADPITGERSYGIQETKRNYHWNIIPFEFNILANGDQFDIVKNNLPAGLNPFLETGLVYFILNRESHWDFFELGMDIGIGAEYELQPNLSLQAGLKRYIPFNKNFGFWDWRIGVVFGR